MSKTVLDPRWISPILALLLAGTVVAGGSGASSAPPAPRRLIASAAPACPLTTAQEEAAVLAFEEMMPVIRHPRCTNCHGGVNPFVPEAQGGHGGGEMDLPLDLKQCQECHDQLPGWKVTGPAMFWPGRTSKEICMQFKSHSPTSAHFVGHLRNDNGGTQFIGRAFLGDRALNDAMKEDRAETTGIPWKDEPPPGTQIQLTAQAQDWVDAVGKGWKATPDCGCEVHRDGWVGRAFATVTIPGDRLTVEERATATVWFERDKSLSGGADEYWKSTAGIIHWTVTFSGQCVGTFSGTTPISTRPSGLGGDGNPIGSIALKPRGNQVRYSVSNAPWQDQYYPVTTVPCGADPPLQVALPRYMSFWWMPDPKGEFVSPDGKLIEGSYTKSMGQGTMKWTWSFRRTRP